VTVRYKQEITVLDKCEYEVPNHIYITDRTWLIGVIPMAGPDKGIEKRFIKPYKQWSATRRKFKELSPKQLQKLLENQALTNS